MTESSAFIKEVNTQNFQQEVLEKSEATPVLINFCTPQAEPCQQLLAMLSKLADEYQGKFVLANIDAVREQGIAHYFGVRGLPSLRLLVGGHIQGELNGLPSETAVRDLLNKFTKSAAEKLQDSLQPLLEARAFDQAKQLLLQAIQQERQNDGLKVELADVYVRCQEVEPAKAILAELDDTVEHVSRVKARLSVLESCQNLPALDELIKLNQVKVDDWVVMHQLALRYVMDEQYERALELLFTVFVKDRNFEDGLARKTMLLVFDILGKGHPLATAARRRLFTLMH